MSADESGTSGPAAHDTTPAPIENEDVHSTNVAMRSRVLNLWLQAEGSSVALSCFNKTKVSGIFRGCDAQQTQFHIDKLETPLGTVESGLIRGEDILTLEFAPNAGASSA